LAGLRGGEWLHCAPPNKSQKVKSMHSKLTKQLANEVLALNSLDKNFLRLVCEKYEGT